MKTITDLMKESVVFPETPKEVEDLYKGLVQEFGELPVKVKTENLEDFPEKFIKEYISEALNIPRSLRGYSVYLTVTKNPTYYTCWEYINLRNCNEIISLIEKTEIPTLLKDLLEYQENFNTYVTKISLFSKHFPIYIPNDQD